MKSFPSAYTIEKNKLVGAKPVWVLRIYIGSTWYYPSGKSLTIPSFVGSSPWPASTVITTAAAVKSFGPIRMGISGAASEYQVSELGVDLLLGVGLVEAEPAFTTPLETLIDSPGIDRAPVELYSWFVGCTDPPQLIYSGRVAEITALTDTTASLRLQDYSIDLETYFVGRKLSSSDYPTAATADIGKMIPIPFGTVLKTPALCAYASATYVYIFSDRAVDTISNVYVRNNGIADININSFCTTYTGQSGSELTGYSGKGVVSITDTQAEQIQTLVQAAVSLGSHTHTSGAGYTRIEFDNVFNISAHWLTGHDSSALNDGNDTTYGVSDSPWTAQADYDRQGSISESGTPIRFRIALNCGSTPGGYGNPYLFEVWISGVYQETIRGVAGSGPQIYYSNWYSISAWSQLVDTVGVRVYDLLYQYLYGVYIEVDTGTSTISYSPASGVSLTIPTPSDAVSEQILVDVVADSGTPSGICNWILDAVGKPDVTVSGTLTVSAFNGLLDSYQSALKWLNNLAWQSGTYFTFSCGAPKLIARTGSGSSKSIAAVIIDRDGRRQLTRRKTDIADLIDKITLLYNRDWTKSRGDDAYKATASGTTGAAAHERPELFMMDFITSSASAAALVTLYLAQFGSQKWLADFEETLEHAELEFGDTAVLSFLSGESGIITAAEHAPGSTEVPDKIKLTVRY